MNECPNHWFMPQLRTIVRNEPGSKWEPGPQSQYPTWLAVIKYLIPTVLISRKLESVAEI